MAGQMLTYRGQNLITPDANPRTLIAIQAATNVRALLKAVEIDPAGTSGPTAPLEFDVVKLSDQTGLVDQSAKIRKEDTLNTETVQTKVWEQPQAGQAEPTVSGEPFEGFALHQQSPRLWVPANEARQIEIPGGTTLGIRARFTAVAVRIGALKFEE